MQGLFDLKQIKFVFYQLLLILSNKQIFIQQLNLLQKTPSKRFSMSLRPIQYDSQLLKHQNHKNMKKHQQKEEWRNSLVSFHQVLNKLKKDDLKRYNQEIIQRYNSELNLHSQPASPYEKCKIRKSLETNKNQDNNFHTNKFVIKPEPWYNDIHISSMERSKNISHTSKSFHITLPNNIDAKKYKINYGRSSSSIEALNFFPQRNKDQKIRKLNDISQQKIITQTFNYTDQQKAKISIEHLAHEKKHRKIEKILKYKAHSNDKTCLKQQKINQHSQFLIDALKKLSLKNLKPSKGIKRKSSLAIQGNVKINSFQKQQKPHYIQLKSISRTKIETSCQSIVNSTYRPQKIKCSVKQLQPQLIKIDELKGDKFNYKISFKPRRNWIFQKKINCLSEKSIKPITMNQKNTSVKNVQKISNHFLKINRLGN